MGDMDWGIWARKLFKGLGFTVLVTAITYIATYLEATDVPAEYALFVTLLYTVMKQAANWIKHEYLVEA